MKKSFLLLVLCAVSVFAVNDAAAQSRYGVIGGVSFSSSNFKEMNRATMTQWHAGLTYKLDLPLGFSLQPSLMYHVKGAKLSMEESSVTYPMDLNIGYVELPVSLQWGPDLLIFRPFLDVTPYVGYAVANTLEIDRTKVSNHWDTSGISRWEYGIGLGVGLEVWRIQVIGRYNWNLGSLYQETSGLSTGFGNIVKTAFDKKNFSGFTLSAVILFGGGRKK